MKQKLIDFLMALACIAIVLLDFLALLGARSVEHETEVTVVGPTLLPDPAVVALAVAPELTAAPESVPTSESDKPAYDPAIPLPEDLRYILWAACEEHSVDPALALGLIEVESGFDPDARNPVTGCQGLMQLNPRYFPADLTAGENIRVGVEYLGQLLARYSTVEAALTAYNAGRDTGSRVYANAVLAAAEKWREPDG